MQAQSELRGLRLALGNKVGPSAPDIDREKLVWVRDSLWRLVLQGFVDTDANPDRRHREIKSCANTLASWFSKLTGSHSMELSDLATADSTAFFH